MLNFQVYVLNHVKSNEPLVMCFITLDLEGLEGFEELKVGGAENLLTHVKEDVVVEEVTEHVVELPVDRDLEKCFGDALKNHWFELCKDGVGGTYFVKGKRGSKMAVFKPANEEAGCLENPKKQMKSPFPGVKPGEGYLREVAAFVMDRENRARVPFTQIINENGRIGSIQKFVDNEGSMADFGSSSISVDNVQNIAQLDIRIFNNDRNEENLLVVNSDDGMEVIPIDHAYSLPSTLGEANFFWLNWKQAKQPISQSMLEYINRIDIESDSQVLRTLGISEDSIKVMKLSTMVLKRGAQVGWNFYQIGSFLVRPTRGEPSQLEILVKEIETKNYWESFNSLLQKTIV